MKTDISSSVARMKAAFLSGKLASLAARTDALRRLEIGLQKSSKALSAALKADLNKCEFEAFALEIAVVGHELTVAQKHLARWMKARWVPTPLLLWPGQSEVHREPLGTVLIIGPWNYPVQLTLVPLVGAIAAGNCAIVKPSELAPRASAALAEMLRAHLSDVVQVVEGGVQPTTELLSQRFDHIFFTGSARVEKLCIPPPLKI